MYDLLFCMSHICMDLHFYLINIFWSCKDLSSSTHTLSRSSMQIVINIEKIEISCIEGYHGEISVWRFFRYIAWSTRVNEVKRATVPSPIYYRGDLNPKPNFGLGFSHLPSELTSPLIYNVQKIYIYLNSVWKY